MRKIVLGVMVVAFSLALASSSFAKKAKKPEYKEGSAGSGSITGTVSLKGTPMAPIIEDLTKGKNVEFCTTHPDAKDGKRPRIKVSVADGKLKDAVVFIENIDTGKPWGDNGKFTWDFEKCDIKQKMGLIRRTSIGKGKEKVKLKDIVKVINQDDNILHNPHGYQIKGAKKGNLFNLPLPSKGSVAEVTKYLKGLKHKGGSHFFLQCDQHNFMEADARILWNPYGSITGADGSFKIDGIPDGSYKVTAWHPYVGEMTADVKVAGGEAKADFTLTAK
jgi:hypothetical protein